MVPVSDGRDWMQEFPRASSELKISWSLFSGSVSFLWAVDSISVLPLFFAEWVAYTGAMVGIGFTAGYIVYMVFLLDEISCDEGDRR